MVGIPSPAFSTSTGRRCAAEAEAAVSCEQDDPIDVSAPPPPTHMSLDDGSSRHFGVSNTPHSAHLRERGCGARRAGLGDEISRAGGELPRTLAKRDGLRDPILEDKARATARGPPFLSWVLLRLCTPPLLCRLLSPNARLDNLRNLHDQRLHAACKTRVVRQRLVVMKVKMLVAKGLLMLVVDVVRQLVQGYMVVIKWEVLVVLVLVLVLV